MNEEARQERQSYPLIHQHLRSRKRGLPPTVASWIGPGFQCFDHAANLENAVQWGLSVKRFPSVRDQLRVEMDFWSAYSQLRLAWWLAKRSVEIVEFEPPTIACKRTDIRCKVGDTEVDLEVYSPRASQTRRVHIESPKNRLMSALANADVLDVDILLDHNPRASYQNITAEAARQVADAIADAIARGLPDQDGVVLTFSDVTVSHIPNPGLPSGLHPDDEPLRVRVSRGYSRLRIGYDVTAFLKKPRPVLDDVGSVADELDWLTVVLRGKADQLAADRVNGIWIEGGNDDDLFSLLTVPWGAQRIVDDFWESPEGKHIDFVGFFELMPGFPYVGPGIRGLGGIMVNPNGRAIQGTEVHEALTILWEQWNQRVRDLAALHRA